jgi:hypothetical protein
VIALFRQFCQGLERTEDHGKSPRQSLWNDVSENSIVEKGKEIMNEVI